MISLLQSYISDALEQQLPDISSLSVSSLQPYFYTPLPDQYSIRLLEIIPCDGPLIQCRLNAFELHDAPHYDALSYTWGDPRPPLFRSIGSSQFQKQHLIKCDDCAVYVTKNLYHALQRLNYEHHTSSSVLQKYIWIDAICINQQDLSERSAQVALMENIYSGAQMAVAWLGKADRYTKLSLQMISRLADDPPRRVKQYGTLNEKYPDISSKDWEALVAFFERGYFRRAWIVQEIMLSKRIIFFIGGEKTSWESVKRASRFITLRDMWKELNIVISYFSSLSGRMEEQGLSRTGTTIAVLSQFKEKSNEMYGNSKIPWYSLTIPITLGRGYLATNKRDHFYSSLGVIKGFIMSAPNLDEHTLLSLTRLPIPDYTKSVSTVFTEFAKWQLQACQNLALLFMVEDQSFRSSDLQDCPSWVPDVSVLLRPPPLQMSGNHWDPSLSEGIGLPVDSPEGSLLLVQGGIFDTITTVAEPLMKTRGDADGWISVLNLIKPLLQSKYPGSGTSYADVLWRTLIADSHSPLGSVRAPRQSPADPRLASAFNEWLISRSLFFLGSRIGPQNFKMESYGKVSRMLLEGIWDQLHCDPQAFSRLSEEEEQNFTRYEQRERSIYQNQQPPKEIYHRELLKLLSVLANMSALDKSGTLFSPSKIQVTVALLHSPESNLQKIQLHNRIEIFGAAMTDIIDNRRLVLTSKGYLGLAARSVAAGDQIWILRGPSTPYTLRPLSNGRYQLMCEAYIHGIMLGEAVKAGGLEFGDIELQ